MTNTPWPPNPSPWFDYFGVEATPPVPVPVDTPMTATEIPAQSQAIPVVNVPEGGFDLPPITPGQFFTQDMLSAFNNGTASSFWNSVTTKKKPERKAPKTFSYMSKTGPVSWDYKELEIEPNEIRKVNVRPGYSTCVMEVRFLYRIGQAIGDAAIFRPSSEKACRNFVNATIVCEVLPKSLKTLARLESRREIRLANGFDIQHFPDLTPESRIITLSWGDFLVDPPFLNPYKEADWI